MSNRFERLFQLPANQYIEGSPVLLVAGVLSKDTETGSIITQLKFQSVSEKCIRAIKISLYAYDVSKTEIQGVNDYQYLELDITNGQEFGSNKAIVMPNPVTRSFTISSIVVAFKDGSMWESSAQFNVLPAAKALPFDNAEMKKQYCIATNAAAKYVPTEGNELWCCSCGTWNKYSICTNCRIAKNAVFSAFNPAVLVEQMNIRLQAERVKREEMARIAAEKEATREIIIKKILKYAVIIGAPILAVGLLFNLWINPYIIQPHKLYIEAQSLVEAGKYEEAVAIFEDLGDYKNSKEQVAFVFDTIQEQKYQHAHNLLDEGDYEGAYKLFCELEDYTDSASYAECFEWVISFEDDIEPEKYTYDASGKLSVVERTDQHAGKEIYTYDSDDNLIQVKYFDEDGVWMTYTYTYYENGLQKTWEIKTNYRYELTKYFYDSNDFLIQKETVDEYGEQISVSSYINDENGHPIEETIVHRNGSTINVKNIYNENGLIIYEESIYNYTDAAYSEQWRSWEYNEHGDAIRYIVCKNGKTTIDTSFVYEYNEEELITQCTVSYLDGDRNVYHYEYTLLYIPK